MTLVAQQIVIEFRDGRSRQLSYQEINRIADEMEKMFGMIVNNPRTFEYHLDRYCQRKGIKPLLIADVLI